MTASSGALLAVCDEVRDLIPPAAVRAGWNIANVSVMVDGTGEENWTADIIGPREVGNEKRRFMLTYGGPRVAATSVRVVSDVIGSIWAPTSGDFIDQVRQVGAALHWADLRD